MMDFILAILIATAVPFAVCFYILLVAFIISPGDFIAAWGGAR